MRFRPVDPDPEFLIIVKGFLGFLLRFGCQGAFPVFVFSSGKILPVFITKVQHPFAGIIGIDHICDLLLLCDAKT